VEASKDDSYTTDSITADAHWQLSNDKLSGIAITVLFTSYNHFAITEYISDTSLDYYSLYLPTENPTSHQMPFKYVTNRTSV